MAPETVRFESTIKGGLPVVVRAWIGDAEPDVGIMYPYIDQLLVEFESGHPYPFDLSEEEYDRLGDEALERLQEEIDQAYEDRYAPY